MDLRKVKKLIEMVEASQIAEITVEDEGGKISVKKVGSSVEVMTLPAGTVPAAVPAAAPAVQPAAGPEGAGPAKDKLDEGLKPIISPMVGTFYRSPSPEAPAFVEVGDTVAVGQVLCIVEAMKLFNEIESEQTGKVARILVQNGEPVEYGQILMLIEEKK